VYRREKIPGGDAGCDGWEQVFGLVTWPVDGEVHMEEVAHGFCVSGEIELTDLTPESDDAGFIQGDPVGITAGSAMQARLERMVRWVKTRLWIE
jgi:hypothetical protein